jgi:acetoin:2,6-dichlorophenolindophenol oxidoreductase subunit alpha
MVMEQRALPPAEERVVTMPLDRDALLHVYRLMRLTRAIEERTRALYFAGEIVGGVYTGAGMEATTVGAASALRTGDVLVPLHRDLGAHLVRGTTPREVFAQWLGRGDSPSMGRDSGLHVGDMRQRMIVPTTNVIGASLPVAAGTALAAKLRGERRVTLAFIGDGGTATGDFHEAMNLAASAWLPLVCVVEHNGYAFSTPTEAHTRIPTLALRAAAYGIPGDSVDGNDVEAVYDAAHAAVERARGGGGPTLVEARTFRLTGHSEADPAAYVPKPRLAEWARRDPLVLLERRLREQGWLDDEALRSLTEDVEREVEAAVNAALAGPPPDASTLRDHVFTDDGSGRVKPPRRPEPLTPTAEYSAEEHATREAAAARALTETVGAPESS